MMPTDRFERQLPGLLDELAGPRTPDYFDSLLGQTARTRQRPAWTILGRWLPMVDVARQPVIAPRLALRTVGLGILFIGLILAVIAAIAIGSRPNLPAPFGPARNGLVAYSANGDIFVVDPASGQAKAVVAGPGFDQHPVWSRDGTRITFERTATAEPGAESIFVVRPDGSQLRSVTTEPLYDVGAVSFSPDGRDLLISATVDAVPSVVIAAVDGGGMRRLETGRPAAAVGWRPPFGDEILFTDPPTYSDDIGFYAIPRNGGEVRTILPALYGRYRGFPSWSPDGRLIAFGQWVDAPELTVHTHIINADGTGERVLSLPPGAVWEGPSAWSNDGTRVLVIRGYDGSYGTSRAVARPLDTTDTGIEIDYPGVITPECCSAWEWAPDDSAILGTPTDATGLALQQVMLDPRTGTTTTVSWSTTSSPTFQRLAY